MLHESAGVRITVEWGVATLWLNFPGEPVNALDAARLRELDAALDVLERHPQIRLAVIRSAKPAGFSAGIHPAAWDSLRTPADRAAFSWLGQTVFEKLASLPQTTIAFVDGPCLDAGFELALACDHRLCVATITTHLGFPSRVTGFGGGPRLRRFGKRVAKLLESGRTLSGREAQALGLVDLAFCERRAKIELRSFLDGLEQRPGEPRRLELFGFAEERRRFSQRRVGTAHQQIPSCTEITGADGGQCPPYIAVALRGDDVVVPDAAPVLRAVTVAMQRGFITPLEADQARGRIRECPRVETPAETSSELVAV